MDTSNECSDSKTDELWQLTACELSAAYAQRTLTPVEVVDALIDRIESENPKFNALCFIGVDDARAGARESERRWRRRENLSQLDGVPVTVKDFFMVRGWPTRRGSRVLDSSPSDTDDAPAVARLREAGAILLGKTTTTEFGHKASGVSPLTGITRNPRNPAWSSGGSSCGAAAAAAAGFGPLHLGSDAAGSIRIPASFCGVYGHKPTSGLVPAFPPSASGHLAVLGPISRSVEDAKIMLETIARPEPVDWRTGPPQLAKYDQSAVKIGELKLALAKGVNDCIAEGDVLTRVRETATALESEGALIEEIELNFDNLLSQFLSLWDVFIATSVKDFSAPDLKLLEPSMLQMAHRGQSVSGIQFNAALLFFSELKFHLAKLFQRFDAVLLPVLPFPAFAAEAEHPGQPPREGWLAWAQTCFLFNATGMPASSVPCGFVENGKPIGMQVVGPAFADAKVMAISRLIEELTPLTAMFPTRNVKLDA